jgi:uncharacterized membrane protein YbhN (UPF0104 family)
MAEVSDGGLESKKRLKHILNAVDRALRWFNHPLVRRITAIVLTLPAVASMIVLLAVNWDTLTTWEWRVRPMPLVISFVAYVVALTTAILAWGQIMNTLGSPVPWRQHVRIYCITNLARRLPGALGHVAGRVILYDDKDTTSRSVIVVGSGLELILTALSGLSLGLLVWPGAVKRFSQPIWIVGGIALGLLIVHPRVIRTLLARLGNGTKAIDRLRYRRILGWLSIYGTIWLAGGIVLFALIEAIYPIPLEWLPRVVGAWSLSGMIAIVTAILPVGLGLRELTLGLFLASFLPEGIAIVIAILSRLILSLYELVGVLIAHRVTR